YLRYDEIGAEVVANVRAHEKEMVEKIASADEQALLLHKKSPRRAVKYLTAFSTNEADALFEKWNELDKYLLVKYIDGNTKRQDETGAFITNGHSATIPPGPIQKGYNERFKRAIVKEIGEKIKVVK
ncbi:MAG TPA: dipeptidase, partial [Bacteroidales bacterium]|nr:dipeptidase [Bacteroidales bacterium]